MKRIPYTPYSLKIVPKLSLASEIKKGYYRFAARETSLCRDEPWTNWMVNHGCPGIISIPNGNTYDYYVEEKGYLRVLKELENEMLKNWQKHLDEYSSQKQRIIEKAKQITNAVNARKRERLFPLYLEWIQQGYAFCDYVWGAWAVIHHTEKIVIDAFPEKMDLIMSLEKPIEYIEMQKALFEIPLAEVVEKYGWLNVYSPYDLPYTEEQVEQMKKELNVKGLEQQYIQFEKNKKEFNHFVETIKNKELKQKVIIVHAYAFLKTDRIDTWRMAMCELTAFFNYLASLHPQLSLKDATNLSALEIKEFLETGKLPDLKHIKLRSANKALYFFHQGIIEATTDEKTIQENFAALEAGNKGITELKGTTACKGKAQGTVKIITHSDHLQKIQEGDIFVAKYTFPSFTPFMLKCAAIVTDEGGITSHAAIVSREYNKPCVINTKRATSILKDGDVVEVDAERGTIKILNHA